MKTTARYLVICLVLTLITVCTAFAAKVTSTNKAKLGTTQLSGENAQIGTTYTLGKTNPINVTVNSIAYTVEQVSIGDNVYMPKGNEKLMVVTFTMHNPQKSDLGVFWNTLKFSVVDSNNTNWSYCSQVGIDETKQNAAMFLKPGQKAKFYTVIVVPAAGEIPKLIIESSDRLVLRYQLHGKVKALPAPIADPNDKTGASALQEVPAKMGDYYPTAEFDVKIESAAYCDDPIMNRSPQKGKRYMVFKGTAKNESKGQRFFGWNRFIPVLTDADGGSVNWNQVVLYASRDEAISTQVKPGNEIRFRYYFEVPEDLDLQTLSLTEQSSRAYSYDVSRVQ